MATQHVAQSVPHLDPEPDRAGDGRLMYYERQVQRSEHYSGPLDDFPLEEVRVLFSEVLAYTGACSWSDFPLPPAGLPGFLHCDYDQCEPAGELIAIGLAYIRALAENERRSMHLRWQEAKDFIYHIERETEKRITERFIEQQTREAEKRLATIEATPQFVYFIAAASGPVKIGIATNLQNRLKGLQTGHHEKLAILASCPGDQALERDYHKRFADRRLSGEWFERCSEIEAEIERLNA